MEWAPGQLGPRNINGPIFSIVISQDGTGAPLVEKKTSNHKVGEIKARNGHGDNRI
jgi:hypothetical protein